MPDTPETRRALLAVTLALSAAPGLALAQAAPTRGALLYDTHCIACHQTQIHWRDQRLVKDWAGLLAEVRAWQSRGRLEWGDADVQEVARFLNDTVYKLPVPSGRG